MNSRIHVPADFFHFSESATKLTALGCFLGCHQMRMFRCNAWFTRSILLFFAGQDETISTKALFFSGNSPRIYTVNSSGFEGLRFQNMFLCSWEHPSCWIFLRIKKKKTHFCWNHPGYLLILYPGSPWI